MAAAMTFTNPPQDHSDLAPAASADPSANGVKFRVLLVDDHPITRQGMRVIIDQEPNFAVCAEAEDGASALRCVESDHPDAAIVDISLRSVNGIDLTRDIKQRAPTLPVLVVSMHEETAYAERALRAGANGYLMKLEAGDRMVTALHEILRGNLYLSSRAQERMASCFTPKRRTEATFPIDSLSKREREVFELIGDGYGTRQIGEKLNLSSKTIDTYREHLKFKLGLKTGADLVRHAIEWGGTTAGR
jgi:DNA-binding NarL/FixJ family response regulator